MKSHETEQQRCIWGAQHGTESAAQTWCGGTWWRRVRLTTTVFFRVTAIWKNIVTYRHLTFTVPVYLWMWWTVPQTALWIWQYNIMHTVWSRWLVLFNDYHNNNLSQFDIFILNYYKEQSIKSSLPWTSVFTYKCLNKCDLFSTSYYYSSYVTLILNMRSLNEQSRILYVFMSVKQSVGQIPWHDMLVGNLRKHCFNFCVRNWPNMWKITPL